MKWELLFRQIQYEEQTWCWRVFCLVNRAGAMNLCHGRSQNHVSRRTELCMKKSWLAGLVFWWVQEIIYPCTSGRRRSLRQSEEAFTLQKIIFLFFITNIKTLKLYLLLLYTTVIFLIDFLFLNKNVFGKDVLNWSKSQ